MEACKLPTLIFITSAKKNNPMGKKLTVKSTIQKYKKENKALKEKFLKQNPERKNTRGIEKTPEWIDLQKKANRTIGRKLREQSKVVSNEILEISDKEGRKLDVDERTELEKKYGLVKGGTSWLAYQQIFYLILSYGTGSAVKKIQKRYNKLIEDGYKVTVVIIYPDGRERSASTVTAFLQYIERFYTELVELDEKLGEKVYPKIDIINFKFTDKTSTITVRLSDGQDNLKDFI